ncbi:MAG: DUF3604 domain-containing protein [Gammaproteobacteria bacterium]|nr:DUF3604 domain-containing protein [Gammaproteobacteria bacterium]
MRNQFMSFLSLAILAGFSLAGCDGAPPTTADSAAPAPESANVAGVAAGDGLPRYPLREAYFGDLHLHTSLSLDAVSSGVRTLPQDAYKFALGESVDYMGHPVQRQTPLDFLAVTDHAEYLGVVREAMDRNGRFAQTRWPGLAAEAEGTTAFFNHFLPSFLGEAPPIAEFNDEALIHENWERISAAADEFYRPGKFTTFVAFEWSAYQDRATMHRVVLFRGEGAPRPFSSLDSTDPRELWNYADAQRDAGRDVLLIPHNTNTSQGKAFALSDFDGNDISREFATRRAQMEPLVEIAQMKGTSETRPEFSPTDEFAGFELVPGQVPADISPGGYVRPGLGHGLQVEAKTGVNPYRYGFVGATDFHSGVSATEEWNFPGGVGTADDHNHPEQVLSDNKSLIAWPTVWFSAGALTGVWAQQNTREEIFDALRRREVFATSGNRIRVRMFASFNYSADVTALPDWLATAYRDGVPMGDDLPATSGGGAPRILLHAVKDPAAANLDRIQVIKVWYADGTSHEKVFDAVWSGARSIDASTGKLPDVGNTVDLATATYSNDIGSAELRGEWVDPEFDAAQSALYYARVLEIPTPRWSTQLAVANGLPLSEQAPPTLQERAWSSPIFYKPARNP